MRQALAPDPDHALATWLMHDRGGDVSAPMPSPPAWHTAAACRGKPTEWWFPERGQQPARGLEVCERCPVRVDCHDWAVGEGFDEGTFGGMTAKTRRPLLGRRYTPDAGSVSPWCACGCGKPLGEGARRPILDACQKRQERDRRRHGRAA